MKGVSVSEIVKFLEARLAEDEAAAQQCCDDWSMNGFESKIEEAWTNLANPERALREVAAKRAIMAEHGIEQDPCDAHDAMYESVPCDVILNLAAIYLDHPDYQHKWSFRN